MKHAHALRTKRSKLAATAAGLFFIGFVHPAISSHAQTAVSNAVNTPQAADIIDASSGVNAHTNLHLDPGNAVAARPMLWQINPQNPGQPQASGARFFQSHPYLYTAPGFSAWVRRPDVVFRQGRLDETPEPLVPSLGADVVYNLSDPTPLYARKPLASEANPKSKQENQTAFQDPSGSAIPSSPWIDRPTETTGPNANEIMQALKQRNQFMLRSIAQSVAEACQAVASE